MPRLLLVIEEVFHLTGRNELTLAGCCDPWAYKAKLGPLFGRSVEFRTADGSTYQSTLKSMEFPNPLPPDLSLAAIGFPLDVPQAFQKAGTEVWLLDESDSEPSE